MLCCCAKINDYTDEDDSVYYKKEGKQKKPLAEKPIASKRK